MILPCLFSGLSLVYIKNDSRWKQLQIYDATQCAMGFGEDVMCAVGEKRLRSTVRIQNNIYFFPENQQVVLNELFAKNLKAFKRIRYLLVCSHNLFQSKNKFYYIKHLNLTFLILKIVSNRMFSPNMCALGEISLLLMFIIQNRIN